MLLLLHFLWGEFFSVIIAIRQEKSTWHFCWVLLALLIKIFLVKKNNHFSPKILFGHIW